MAITFSRNQSGGYLEITYSGQISDSELLSAYESYFSGDDAIPVLNDLTDLSEADLTHLSRDAIQELANYITSLYEKYGITSLKTAIYAPNPLKFGLARMYGTLSFDTPQDIQIFKDRHEAIQWLTQADNR